MQGLGLGLGLGIKILLSLLCFGGGSEPRGDMPLSDPAYS